MRKYDDGHLLKAGSHYSVNLLRPAIVSCISAEITRKFPISAVLQSSVILPAATRD